MCEKKQFKWWQGTIIYQIYPRSFFDSNQDGIGDLNGIISKLDYLSLLGIESIWLSPVYPSPMADFGYDISDYCGIDPLFGNLSDFDRLLSEIHSRNMKLILDFVPNHTSDQHPWFLASKSSRQDPKRDWYIWQDASPDGGVPNNWLAMFGGSAWEWDAHTQQYYYHGFLSAQPDLNWRNPEVQQAMFDSMKFWLDKGVDGFRVDVIWHLIKDALLRDNPENPQYKPHMATYNRFLPLNSTDQPEVHELISKMRVLLDGYQDRMMIGEIYLPLQKLMAYYGTDNNGVHMPFNFTLLETPWEPATIGLAIDQYESALPEGGWPNWVLGNHDQRRIASRIGPEQSRVAAVLLLTLRGTPTMYYGDELGMEDVLIPFDEIQDPQGLNMPDKNLSRDPARTPMQWNEYAFSGFSEVKPWLRVAEDYKEKNVELQSQNPDSLLNLYKRIIHLRMESDALRYGTYRTVFTSEQILAYTREIKDGNSYLIVLNFSHAPAQFKSNFQFQGEVVLSANNKAIDNKFKTGDIVAANEAIIVELKDI